MATSPAVPGPPAESRRRRTLPAGIEVTVSVPATSANLGPGFDTMGLALDLRDEVTVRTLEAGAGFHAEITGEGAGQLPTDGRHLIITTVRAQLARAGWDLGGLVLTAQNRIPHGRGLGSSATAHATAVLIAQELLPAEERATAEQVLDAASELEGHPDNVAPALSGGLALSWQEAHGYRSVRLEPHQHLVPVVAVPSEPLSTETARGLLPAQVSHADAAANAGRAALLVHGLTVDPSVLLAATEDRLHQQFRAPAMPESLDLVRSLRAEGLPAVVSGAGPTVLVLTSGAEQAAQAEHHIRQATASSAQQWRVSVLPVDRTGAKVKGHR